MKKEKPRQVGAFLCFWRREPESNRSKRLCRPLHNRFAIAPQADCRTVFSCVCNGSQIFSASTPTTHRGQSCSTLLPKHQTKREAWLPPVFGAGDESRTRDLNLGKVALYQLSYSRINLPLTATTLCLMLAAKRCFENWSGRRVSNSRPQPWQGCALPTELLPHFAAVFSSVSRCLLARAPEKRDYVEGAESCQPFLYERLKILATPRAFLSIYAMPPRSRICGHASFM